MSIKAGLHSVAAMALLPAGALLRVAASGPEGPQEPKLLFHSIYQQRLGDLMLGSGVGWLPTQALGGIWVLQVLWQPEPSLVLAWLSEKFRGAVPPLRLW